MAQSNTAVATDDVAAAKEHFLNGKKLYDLGKFADAAAEYELAYQAKDDPALLFNIGQAYRLAGNLPKAILAYKAYLRNTPDATNREEVENRIRELQASQSEPHSRLGVQRPPEKTVAPTVESPSLTTASPINERRKPLYKRWWPWTIAGVVVVGAAVGVTLGLTLSRPSERVLPAIGGAQ